ncbi:MAG: HlyD family efflux transporter periplasmic adaptor subunit [Planctomycetota bacterium]
MRRNLGITFAAAERRAVTQTVRVPGQFELLPSARRDYHAPVAGRIELYVEQYAEVKAGQLLATIDSPDWREQQAMVTQAASAVLTTEAAVTIAEVTLHEQEQQIRLLEERVDRLASAEVRRVELNNDLKQARLVLPRLEAELQAARVQVSEVKAQRRAHLQTASSKTGLSVERLSEVVGQQDGEPMERWQQLDAVPIAAISDGVVDLLAVTSGRWVETGDEIVVTIQPDRLRFHADTLLADATSLRSGLPARVVPPSGQGIQISESGVGELFVGPTAHTDERTISLYTVPEKMPGWAKAGVPGFIEVVRNPDTPTALAIPRSALVQDGLDFVFFRRLPGWPDEVQRVVADTGESDGRWIEISSGLNEGDEVVVDGVYQLLAASSTTLEEGGHFHSDGTFHEGEDE